VILGKVEIGMAAKKEVETSSQLANFQNLSRKGLSNLTRFGGYGLQKERANSEPCSRTR